MEEIIMGTNTITLAKKYASLLDEVTEKVP